MKKIITALSLLCFLCVNQAKASHIAGGDLSYVCLGGNQYQINLNLFVDCLGFDPGSIQSISYTSTCGGSATSSVTCTNPGGTEISQLCAAQINNSTCHGGPLPGMWVFHYTGTVTLAPPCDTWTMSWTTCCRNAAILNLNSPSSFGSYIQATLNSATAPCNNSPSFTAQPIPYVCQGQPVNYSYGVVETDGDSLYYSFIGAMDAGATLLTYSGGYSATSPIPGMTINPSTGMLSFTPTTLGNFVVVVLVKEYDAAGNLIGTVMRDIQFIVQTCSNIVPDNTAGAITGMTGSAVQTGPFSIELCEGSNFTFNTTYTDANSGDSLVLISNIDSVLAGAVFTYTGANPTTATISWTAPAGSANTNTTFSITVNDGACPVPGQQTFVYDIQVQPRTLAGPDQVICGPQTATLAGTGGSTFTWAVISGPPMVVGTNFSCNPCANPVASPVSTTTYEVTSDLSGTCVNKDTVTITVVPDYTFTTTQSTATLCMDQTVQFNVTGSPAGTYTYLWSPGATLDSTTIGNPTATLSTAGTYTYYVNITSPLGCIKKDTVTATVLPAIRTNANADTTLCAGQSANLSSNGGTSFTWSVITGPAIVVGTNFSCINCANPVATPSATTTYLVTSDLTGTCVNKDTVTVTVVPDYTVTTTQSSATSCLTAPVQINTSVTPAGTYIYSWSPATYLSSSSSPNPVATITAAGIYSYVLTTTSSSGCVKLDTTTITIAPSYPPNPTLSIVSSPACVGDTVQLNATFGSAPPAVCGINPVGCTTALASTVGTMGGSNTSTTWPAIFGNWYTSEKHQMLFRASELNAAGITAGKIDQIDIPVSMINGITTYHQFTVSMGCTNLNALGTTWAGGLFQVFNPATVNVIVGMNTIVFNNAFEWDGISNIVVQICSTEGPGPSGYFNYTQSSISPYAITTFTSCLYSYTDAMDMCPDMTNFITQTVDRPILTFHYCGSAPDSTNFTYSWSPNPLILSPASQTTGALVPAATTYTLVTTDNLSGCADTSSISVTTLPSTVLAVSAGSDSTICPGASTVLHATGATNYSWSPATGLSSTTSANPTATPPSTTTYTVTGTATCATPATDVVTISTVNSVIITVDAGNDVTICPGVPTQLTATGATSYSWSPALTLSNPLIATPFASPLATTTYTVTGSAYCANSVTDTVHVNVKPSSGPLTSDAGPGQQICLGEQINLNGTTSGGYGNNTTNWSIVSGVFADSINGPSSLNAFVTTTIPGTSVYQLSVIDQCGYITYDTVVFDVNLDCQVIVPNIFTPNGDGINDSFVITGKGISTFAISIYNRWGEKVFESTDAGTSWNGGNSNDGTYYYILKATTVNGKAFDKQGYVQLLSN